MITETQELLLRLIEKTSFNNFSGPRVAWDLRANKGLWRSVMMTRFVRPAFQKAENPVTATRPPIHIYHQVDLMPLRTVSEDSFSADHLIIHTEPGKQDKLEALAEPWNTDAAAWVLADEAFRGMGVAWRLVKGFAREDRALYVLWWD
jgi:hypothetical protein